MVIITPASKSATPTPSLDEEEEEFDDMFDDESDTMSFYNFSRRYFQNSVDHKHTPQRLKQPLLHHEDEGDGLVRGSRDKKSAVCEKDLCLTLSVSLLQASLTVSWIIMRFMGDIPEQKPADSVSQHSSTISQSTIPRLLPNRQGRRLSSLVGLDQKILRRNKKKLSSGTRKASTILEEPENLTEDEDILVGEGPTLDRQLTQLEKLHIIVGYGLSREGIRDEIYCQICKQLVNNRNRKSCMQGWVLLALCLGIFPPTDLFMGCLKNFLRRGPNGYREYCTLRLRRIVHNGERKELPCWIEQQAAIKKEPIDWAVTLMNGETVTLPLDSASTSFEVCQAVANKIGLKDTFGFSLYISFYEKMWSLDCSKKKHVLDAVSQCEQEMRRQGREEKETPWTLSIRKELFAPWHDCSQDPVSTDLIYKQVVKGIKSGEYVSEKDDEYVQLAAMHHFIQFGSQEVTRDNVQQVVQECIPTTQIENKSMTKWIELITAELLKETYNNGRLKAEKVKGDLVDIARQNWPLDFSKLYEVTMTSGPPLPKSRFFVSVNWKTIVFMEKREKILLEIPYIEVKNVQIARSAGKEGGKHGYSKWGNKEKLWAFSKEPIKQPLMKTLAGNPDLSSLACNAFTDIL
ncbi:hypothetical protein GOODEAATRI_013808 [Goodea atripinnis]|uniref:Uncharacterized protein n=1 Tax=Goodea atripinnis TaxID=208336 RepID=A0ABV0NLL1_9TELE